MKSKKWTDFKHFYFNETFQNEQISTDFNEIKEITDFIQFLSNNALTRTF